MKKIALLLALLLLVVPVCAACGGTEESSSESPAESAAESAESSKGERSEASSGKETSSEESGEEKPVFVNATNIALGCSYTTTPEAASQYEDSYHSELTDGLFATDFSYGDTAYAGYSPESTLTVVIDLGEVREKIYAFSVDYLHTMEAGIAPPALCKVSYSDDNKNWENAGDAKRKSKTAEMNSAQQLVLELDGYVSARYVRLILTKGSFWMFLDEIEVIADVEGVDYNVAYVDELLKRYGEDNVTYDQRVKLLSSVKGGKVDFSKTRVEVSAGKLYTLSEKCAAGFEDSDAHKLTDGVVSGYLESGAWIAFSGEKDVEIVLDLAKERDDLVEFDVSAYSNGKTSGFPVYVSYEVSTDKKTFVEIGRVYGPSADQRAFSFLLTLRSAIKARYVKCVLHCGEQHSLMQIEEFGVYSYGEPPADEALYPQVVFPKVTGDSLWPSSEKDYDKQVNLLLNLPVQVEASAPETKYKEYNTEVSSKLLTNGKRAGGTNIHGGEYFKFNSCGSRSIYFDLGHLSQIDAVYASFLSYVEWGVRLPSSVSVALSDNAVDWYMVGTLDFDGAQDYHATEKELKFNKPYAARFVRYSFDIYGWMASDEMRVLGTKKVGSGAVRLANSGIAKETVVRGKYLTPRNDLLGGAQDICLMYHGQKLSHSVEETLPYVAYLDKEGNIVDTMFDGFLYLLSGSFPSGVAGHLASKKSDWEWTLTQLFTSGKNLQALDEAVGQVNEALGLNGRKVDVFVTLYYLRPELKNFGDVDGDGVGEDLSVLENRFKVIRWYMDTFEKRFAEANFKNLSFSGYYWYHESIPGVSEDADARAYITGTAKIAHERGSQLFWIPYYSAYGYSDWAQFGLDAACFQPNYAFHADVLEKRLDSATQMAKNLGMCIEIEIDDKALTDEVYFRKYMDYMKHGVTDGFMKETIHMYYQSGSIFRQACASKSDKVRLIYDYTYQFIKKKLNAVPDALDPVSAQGTKDTVLSGKLADANDGTARYRLVKSPEHGTVSVSEDGTFCYYPDKNYTGKDSFEYVFNAYLGDSAPCKCEVEVK